MIGTTRALLEAHKVECAADREATRSRFDEVRRAQSETEARLREATAHMHAENTARLSEMEASAERRFDRLETMNSRAMAMLISLLLSVLAFGAEHLFGKLF